MAAGNYALFKAFFDKCNLTEEVMGSERNPIEAGIEAACDSRHQPTGRCDAQSILPNSSVRFSPIVSLLCCKNAIKGAASKRDRSTPGQAFGGKGCR